MNSRSRVPVLYLAPWVESDAAGQETVDWFEQIDRSRWAPSLITTQPSANGRLPEIEPWAEEVWDLPDLLPGAAFPPFILGFVESRGVKVVHVAGSRLGFDLLPDMTCLAEAPVLVVRLPAEPSPRAADVAYPAGRYGSLVDAFSVGGEPCRDAVAACGVPASRVEVIRSDAAAADTAPARDHRRRAPGALAGAFGGDDGHGDGATTLVTQRDERIGDGLGRRHDELYDRLLATRSGTASATGRREARTALLDGPDVGSESSGPRPAPPVASALFTREPPPERSIGVIVPCFRHGIYLDECVRSIEAQTLAPAAIVVVDDGSDDPETFAALAELEGNPRVTVLRQPANLGPSAARNRALAELDTAYVLPLDADDVLLPDALERMVAQLEAAPADVGFVYPSAQHTGHRSDFVPSPAYNLWFLMNDNYCPAPALFDRRAFEAGASYPASVVFGHEDWDLLLQLAELGIRGEHVAEPTFLYRKYGFSRIDSVEHDPAAFRELIERRHPALYRNRDRIKARWAPALSVVLADDASSGAWRPDDLAGLPPQTCSDFEIVASRPLDDDVRVAEPEDDSPAGRLQASVAAARGRWVLVLTPAAAMALRDSTLVERLIRGFWWHEDIEAVVLGTLDGAGAGHAPFAQLSDTERLAARPVAIAYERTPEQPSPPVELGTTGDLMADMVLSIQAHRRIQWRLAPTASPSAPLEPSDGRDDPPVLLQLDRTPPRDRGEEWVQRALAWQEPQLPGLLPGPVRRWELMATWLPPAKVELTRHRASVGEGRIVTTGREPPPGYEIEFDLGAVHRFALPGTRRLVDEGDGFALTDDQNDLGAGRRGLGYIERTPLPGLERLELRRLPETGEPMLVAGVDDPLHAVAEPVAELGWIESFPIAPRRCELHLGPWGVTALRRRLDGEGWRHRYGAGVPGEEPGTVPAGEGSRAVTLGSLWREPGSGLVALRRLPDGRLETDLAGPSSAGAGLSGALHWALAPLAWDAPRAPRWARRALIARARRLLRRTPRLAPASGGVETLGWLRRSPATGYSALFSATHPVTGDQFVTRSELEATDLGYLIDGVLGHVQDAGADPPVVLESTPVPCGSRLGRGRRYVEGEWDG